LFAGRVAGARAHRRRVAGRPAADRGAAAERGRPPRPPVAQKAPACP